MFFDVLRVICILNVIAVIHARQYSEILCQTIDSHFPAWGYIVGSMAALFFASGYLLSKANTIYTLEDAIKFAEKRVLRILPLFVVSLLTIPYPEPFWRKSIMLLGVNNFLGFTLSTLWFVSVLIVFYMLFPFLQIVRRTNLVACVLLGLMIYVLFVVGVKYLGFEARLLYYFPFFCLGIIAAEIRATEGQMVLVALPIVILYFVARVLGWFDGVEVVLRPLRFFVVVVVAYGLSLVVPLRRFWGALAYSSFCAYLFHRQIYDLFLHRWFHFSDGSERILLIYCLVPLTFALGYAVQFGYDAILKYTRKKVG
ncbi:MAG: acyltransferase [Lentisphaerae bacterium]|nr:acyltransferase [Lentisphaerota bacterium]